MYLKDFDSKLIINHASRVVLTIDNTGRLIPGPDLSMDEVTQGVFAALATSLPKYAEIERLRKLLTRYRDETPLGHQPHMIADEVDAALGRK